MVTYRTRRLITIDSIPSLDLIRDSPLLCPLVLYFYMNCLAPNCPYTQFLNLNIDAINIRLVCFKILHLMKRLKMRGATPPLPYFSMVWYLSTESVFMAWDLLNHIENFTFTFDIVDKAWKAQMRKHSKVGALYETYSQKYLSHPSTIKTEWISEHRQTNL
jgi:hypothetical protein